MRSASAVPAYIQKLRLAMKQQMENRSEFSRNFDQVDKEQDKFEAFLERLRDAKDKAEFDQFMDERAKKAEERAPEA